MPILMTPLAITAYTATSAMGSGLAAQLAALEHARSGLRPNDISSAPLACWIGRVDGVEDTALPATLAAWDCRNNRLAWLGLQQDGFLERVRTARARHGAHRVALLLGTSTASRSEEHTSELPSLMRISYAVFCLKKKKKENNNINK